MRKNKVIKLIENFFKRITINLNNFFEKYENWIIGGLFIIFTLLALLTLFQQTKILTYLLGFNPNWIFAQFIGISYIFFFIYISRRYVLKILSRTSLFYKILKKLNHGR